MFAEVQIASLLPYRCECSVVHGCANIGRTGKSPRVCDPASGEFTVVWPSGLSVAEGPATVLRHSHDEKPWDIEQMRIKGRLEPRADRWVFISTDFGRPPRSQLTLVRGLSRDMRNAGRRYLDGRGLVLPTVNRKALQALRRSTSAKTSSRLL